MAGRKNIIIPDNDKLLVLRYRKMDFSYRNIQKILKHDYDLKYTVYLIQKIIRADIKNNLEANKEN